MFSCEFGQIFQNTFLKKHFQADYFLMFDFVPRVTVILFTGIVEPYLEPYQASKMQGKTLHLRCLTRF